MEKHDAIGLFVQSESIITKFRELLKLNDSAAFRGQYVVKLCDVASDVNKVHQYIIDDKDGAKWLHGEMLNLRTLTRELRDEAFQKGFEPFAHNCDTIISIIDDMERWTPDVPNTEDNYPMIPKAVEDLFPNKEKCAEFVKQWYGKNPQSIAKAYIEEKGVIPPNSGNSIAVGTQLYNYFIKPFKPTEKGNREERYCDKSSFYKYFRNQ